MMKQIVVTSTKSKIKIGYEGENQVTKLIFPYDESWLQYGDGEFKIRILRNGDKEAYNATEIVDDRESMILTMTVTNIELSVKGRGEMQLCYICESGCIKKSPIYEYVVSRSVDSIIAENPPSSSIIPYDIQNSLYEIHDLIGDLSKLNTNNKDNLVSAINEINQSGGGSGGGEQPSITIDSELSSISENPVQNKIITQNITALEARVGAAENTIQSNMDYLDNKIDETNEVLDTKADNTVATQSNNGLMSSEDKLSLDNVITSVGELNSSVGNISNSIEDINDTIGNLDGNITDLQSNKLDKSSVDSELSQNSENPIQNKAVTNAINNLSNIVDENLFSFDAKHAIINCLSHVIWDVGNPNYYIKILKTAFGIKPLSINAIYTQTKAISDDTPINDLKTNLVVTCIYTDNTTLTLGDEDYNLSGILSVGTSVITVEAENLTTTFSVEVSKNIIYDWDFTKSMTDSIGNITANTNYATINQDGLLINQDNTYVELLGVFDKDRTYEIDIVSINRQIPNEYGRIWIVDSDNLASFGGSGYVLTGGRKNGDLFYINGGWESNSIVSKTDNPDGSYYNNSTLGFYVDNDGYVSVYKNGVLLGKSSKVMPNETGSNLYIGSSGDSSRLDALRDTVISGYRVYSGFIYS